MDIKWDWKNFEELSPSELYEILDIRYEVFITEQKGVYRDIDNLDQYSWHLLGKLDGKIIAYLRLIFPSYRDVEPAISRALVLSSQRSKGFGKIMIKNGIAKSRQEFPKQDIKISAQQYLEKFYSDLGFIKSSDIYNKNGIDTINMIYPDEN